MRLECHCGEIYYIRSISAVGCEQYGDRPGIIVSNEMNNRHSDTVEVVYLTTKRKKPLPTHVRINSAKYPSTALCEQITTVAKERLDDYIGKLSVYEERALDAALMTSIALDAGVGASGARGPESADF